MRQAVKHDLRLERRHWRTICAILGNQFFKKDIEADLNRGSDMVLASINGRVNVGCRLRTNYYYKNPEWTWQVTVRWSRPSGVETEIHKMRKGLYDYMIYGFVSEDESKVIKWIILRCSKILEINPPYSGPYRNNPPDSQLIAYNIKDIQPAIINYWPKEIWEFWFDSMKQKQTILPWLE